MPRLMFDRNVDFKLETTVNPYAACRALSQRARQLNTEQTVENAEAEIDESVNPTATALSDYATGRIVLTEEEAEEDSYRSSDKDLK